jgi:FAD/FMN-containing dehydrogenase
MAGTTLDESAIAVIRDRFEGELLEPGADGYDQARAVYNAMIDRRPRLIARCAGAADVVAGVLLARETGLPLAVKGGGHGVNGHAVCDDGIMLDLSPMRRIDVDPEARVVRAQAGVTWGEFDAATQEHGLATTGGRVTTTGIAGLTLGAGSGWLERMFGYTSHNLVAADVVTADGRLVRASEDENPDLFWGLRGGGGNFGVVTQFEYRLHDVGPIVTGGMVVWPIEQAGEVVRFYRDWMESAPDEVGGGAAIFPAPPEDFIPAELHGKPVVAVIPVSFGDPELLRPIREFGRPAADVVGPMPYLEVQKLLDPGSPWGFLNYWKAEIVAELSDEVIDLNVAHGQRIRSPLTATFFQPLGGALARVDDAVTAINPSVGRWVVHGIAVWEADAESEYEFDWVRQWGELMAPYVRAGVPLTFSADAGDDRVRATFGKEKYARLVALKDKYDPENLFHLNQNIKPSASG